VRGFWLIVVAVLGGACGGRVTGGDLDSGSDEASAPAPHDPGVPGSPSVDFPICPPLFPQVGTACPMSGQVCKYFSGSACEAAACDQTSHWHSAPNDCL
jgi:hypothetical protein